MKKRLIVLFLAATMMLSLAGFAYAEEFSGIVFEEAETFLAAEGEASPYVSVMGSFFDDRDIETGFIYSDDMLLQDSYTLSGDLAKLAVTLSMAAYSDDGASAKAMLESEEMGYSVGCFDYNYPRTLDDNDRVAYIIGRKELKGKVYYCVVIRGTNGLEWFSDFNMGDPLTNDGKHLGFDLAASQVIETLDSLFSQESVRPENRFILFTGHSRGAAVANVLAAHYSKCGGAPANQIFGYTFACPAVDKRAGEVGYENIFNFNNTGDAIPTVPLKEWGHNRFGIDIPCGFTSSPVFSMRYYNAFGTNNASTGDTVAYEYAIKTLFPEETTVNEPLGHLGAMLLAWKLSGSDDVSFNDLMVRYGKDIITDQFLYEQILNRNGLESAYQLLSGNYSEYESQQQFIQDAINYWNTQEYSQEAFDAWLQDNSTEIREIYNTTGEIIESLADLPTALNTIIKLAPIAWDIGTVFGCVLDITEHSAGGPMEAITDGHRGRTYVLGINSQYYGFMGCIAISDHFDVHVPDCVKTIGDQCFENSNIESFTGNQIEYIGHYAFLHCENLHTLGLGNVSLLFAQTFQGCTGLENLYIPDNVKVLETVLTPSGSTVGPFEDCTGLKTISVGGVEELQSKMLKTKSSALEKLTVRGTVKTIGERAFYSADYYDNNYDQIVDHPVELVIEPGVEHIEQSAFSFCSMFTSVTIPSTVKEIGEHAFYACSGLKKLSIECIDMIGDSAFAGCRALEEITLKDIKTIPPNCFAGCVALNTLVLHEVESIEGGAFSGCSQLNMIKWDGIKRIGAGAFSGCESLENLYIPDSVKELEVKTYGSTYGPFENCTGLKQISVGGIETITSSMLKTGSTAIEKLTIRGTVSKIDDWALNSNDYAGNKYNYNVNHPVELILEEGVETIGSCAFQGCSMFTSVTIPSTIKNVGSSAFAGCSSLKDIYYNGSYETWNSIYPTGKNDISEAKLHYISELIPDFIFPAALTAIADEAFTGGAFFYVKLPDNAVSIGYHAFADCPNLAHIYIPAQTTEIDEEAFGTIQGLTILGKTGSTAETYARNHDFNFIAVP